MKLEQEIFKKGSTTYYFSSKFFPRAVREDVFKLYSFVRVADDYVDTIPSNASSFNQLVAVYDKFLVGADAPNSVSKLNLRVAQNIVDVTQKYQLNPEWIASFLASMRADIRPKPYQSIDDSLWYVYGSAEVIGLMMAKILRLPEESMHFAKMQGRAMQWINFIRDIDEDNQLGRCYFPVADLKEFGLTDLTKQSALSSPQAFNSFIKYQITRYKEWEQEANKGYQYIPSRLKIPLATARDMYNWTAQQIEENPLIVFDKKVKPSRQRVVATVLKNTKG
jgi:15-cis-phytoene synthase